MENPHQQTNKVPYLAPSGYLNQLSTFNRQGHYKEEPPTKSIVLSVGDRHISYPNANVKYYLTPFKKNNHGNKKANYELNNVNQFKYQPPVNIIPLFTNQYNSRFQMVQSIPTVSYINRNHNLKKQNKKYIRKFNGRTNVLQREPSSINFNSLKKTMKKSEDISSKNEDGEFPVNETTKVVDTDKEKLIREDEEHDRNSQSYDFEENDKDVNEEEYEQDNKRDSSMRVISEKYPGKQTERRKTNLNNHYKFHDIDYKQEHSKPIFEDKKSKMISKSIKFSKKTDDFSDDSIDSKHSEMIPVIHKHRLFKEKWYLLKNIEDTDK